MIDSARATTHQGLNIDPLKLGALSVNELPEWKIQASVKVKGREKRFRKIGSDQRYDKRTLPKDKYVKYQPLQCGELTQR